MVKGESQLFHTTVLSWSYMNRVTDFHWLLPFSCPSNLLHLLDITAKESTNWKEADTDLSVHEHSEV